ncbi:MAG: hypothetical protein KBD26_01200 [Candidatus Pacebacteria bacterium]|nr:hypothetical protein [Candidatus Paceibacterota bacterium]MBP9772425.1 hypothetical protein [Candidatus Paceibacterota bacterium]QQR76467.1 MAG: hypothetical protein IPJ63_03145 [Candidatus Nomurabacteria bacterium]
MSTVSIEIKKNTNENNASVLRRFTRRVQEAGLLQKVKGNRYSERPLSKLALKKGKLKNLAKRKNVERLKKLGKIVERSR